MERMPFDPSLGEPINLFSLVTYLPEPLGSFIDGLRCELVPGCKLRAHVTLLPPRALVYAPDEAWAHIRSQLRNFKAFEVKLKEVEIFPRSTVVYVALGQGLDQMQALHGALNAEAAYFKEPFPYHPHITLAQQILEAQVPAVFELARYRWAVFPHERAFPVDRAVWVQCTRLNNWIDLDEDVLE